MHMGEDMEFFKLVRGIASIVERARPWIERGDMRPLLEFATCERRASCSNEVHSRLESLITQQAGDHHPPG